MPGHRRQLRAARRVRADDRRVRRPRRRDPARHRAAARCGRCRCPSPSRSPRPSDYRRWLLHEGPVKRSVVYANSSLTAIDAARGAALRSALAAQGITASGRSGFTCWVPVADEDGVASALAAAGWAVAPGQRFRIAARPGVRICFARLAQPDAAPFAAGFARALRHRASRLD